MDRAIEERVLCQYKYFPHLVPLTPLELEEYVRISKKLMTLFDFKNGKFKESDLVETLLLARKRVIHKAANKLQATREILREHFLTTGDLKFSFVYVPEGFATADGEQWYEDEEELRLINQYSLAIGNIGSPATWWVPRGRVRRRCRCGRRERARRRTRACRTARRRRCLPQRGHPPCRLRSLLL